MIATWEGYRRNRGLSNIHNVPIHRQHIHVYKENFVYSKDTRLSDIYDSYLGGIQAKQRAIKYSYCSPYTGNTDTYTRGISYMQRIKSYQEETEPVYLGGIQKKRWLSNIHSWKIFPQNVPAHCPLRRINTQNVHIAACICCFSLQIHEK
jgi:hypothetical protein